MILQSLLEILIAAVLIVGLVYEDKIAQVEQKIIKKWRENK